MMTMRGNARGRKEEVHTTIGDEGVGEDTTRWATTTGESTQQLNGSRERGYMVMVRSKEGCAVGRGGARRRFLFIFRIETNN
jgi:hypothetical protein